MGGQTVYFKKETLDLIKIMRERHPDFNLAEFIRKALEMEITGKSESQETFLNNKIAECVAQEHVVVNQREMWEQRLKAYHDEQAAIAEKVEKERKYKEDHKDEIMTRLGKALKEKLGYDVYKKGLLDGSWDDYEQFYEKMKDAPRDNPEEP